MGMEGGYSFIDLKNQKHSRNILSPHQSTSFPHSKSSWEFISSQEAVLAKTTPSTSHPICLHTDLCVCVHMHMYECVFFIPQSRPWATKMHFSGTSPSTTWHRAGPTRQKNRGHRQPKCIPNLWHHLSKAQYSGYRLAVVAPVASTGQWGGQHTQWIPTDVRWHWSPSQEWGVVLISN